MRKPATAVISFVIASALGIATLFWFAADRSVSWIDLQRTELTRQFTESGTRNRRIFREAQERIAGSVNATQNTIELRNERDTLTLALAAATDVSCPLASHGPLGLGAPCRMRDPSTVAEEVVRTIPIMSYPITVSPQNRWSEAAVSAQLDEALSFATNKLRPGMTELKDALFVVIRSAACNRLWHGGFRHPRPTFSLTVRRPMKNHLFIGLGGQGGRTLGELRKVMAQRAADTQALKKTRVSRLNSWPLTQVRMSATTNAAGAISEPTGPCRRTTGSY